MSVMYLGTISGSSTPISVNPLPKSDPPSSQQIDNQLKAQGTRVVAENAYESALQNLSKLLSGINVQISTYLERETGLQRVAISDGQTGKRIVDCPPARVTSK